MKLEWVYLDDIEDIDINELNNKRLEQLENGYCSFEELIYGMCSDPITIDGSTYPYKIIDGRHRIFLARKKGYNKVKAQIL